MSIPITIEKLLNESIAQPARIEFKESWNPDTTLKTISAFANDFDNYGGGYILIGIKENQGKIDLSNSGLNINEINSIEFKNVSFSYDNKINIINNLSFKIEKGDKVAIVGASGMGKSTILQLLMKVYNEYTGEILINGINLKDINKSSIYDRISLVEQNMFIFNGTIRENIIFNNNNNKIEESLKISSCNEFINDYDKSLYEVLLEGGKNISGGQMQRICICRALEKNFDTLILDESTSALDKLTEEKVINNINDYIVNNNKILITISHRDKPTSICNKIINLNSIKITEN